MESKTTNSTKPPSTCHVCGKSFSRRSNVHRHIREMHDSVRDGNSNDSKLSDTTDVNRSNPPETTPDYSRPSARIVGSSWVDYPSAHSSRVPSVTYELNTNSTGRPATWLESVFYRNESAESAISESLRASIMASGGEPRQDGSGNRRVEEDRTVPQGEVNLDDSGREPTAIHKFYASQFRSTPTTASQANPSLAQSTNRPPNQHNRTGSETWPRPTLELEDLVDMEALVEPES